ncbi:hypothetical protein BDU57DRAFT_251317 [Ampelomyces quisqualis]|uniref:Cora-like Mg2+ transporter protein-domain-containing protein n=1 Tax=Ampelomyces quisqualis TaxID=50730 RepID=A0A6A5QQ63_AMPQU|nr:hypothetical protein BDU57DRAFT_251317 [Ampelomyces quisqualis]
MESRSMPVPDVDDGPDFSKLESTIVTSNIELRPISRDGQHIQRHADAADTVVNELDYDYEIDPDTYPLSTIHSVQDLFSCVQYHEHVCREQNFDVKTRLECLSVDCSGAKWMQLDEGSLKDLLDNAASRCIDMPPISTRPMSQSTTTRKALMFLIPLTPASKITTSYGNTLPMTRTSITKLFSSLQVNPAFIQNLLGRPDYWAPQGRWDEEDGQFLCCDFWCQHPRWNLQVQGAPLSVYSKYDAQKDLTVYLVSHKPNDTVINSLRKQLDSLVQHPAQYHISDVLLESPYDLHVMISNLNMEGSKWHVERFRRFQWKAVNDVDDHLAGKGQHDRKKLASLLKTLQIVSQNSDSHLANAQNFLFTARAILDSATKLDVSRKRRIRQRTLDMLRHLIESMEKQHMWFLNYKSRKESVMNLVFHFGQQTDNLNNIELSADMKRDSTSMNAIAGLTMIFLPGTFTASVLSSGIFKSEAGARGFQVTGLWWLWLVITLPITLITVLSWWFYRKRKEKTMQPVQLWFKNDEPDQSVTDTARKASVVHTFKGYMGKRRKTGTRKSNYSAI